MLESVGIRDLSNKTYADPAKLDHNDNYYCCASASINGDNIHKYNEYFTRER